MRSFTSIGFSLWLSFCAALVSCLSTSQVRASTTAETGRLIQLSRPQDAHFLYAEQRLQTVLSKESGDKKGHLASPQSIILCVASDPVISDLAKLGLLSASDLPQKPEGYVLLALRDGRMAVIGTDTSGVIYGALDLAKRLDSGSRLPENLKVSEAPAFKLRGPCIGMQKTYILPGYHVYEYPYREDLFPFFYDKAFWSSYLDFLADNRMNTLYLWSGHPFASLVKVKEYPYALEVSEEQYQRNVEMFRYIASEADKRGIWVVQMFYSIILSKPFAEHNHIATQLQAPVPVASDYTRKSIAEFVRQYPNVGLMVCLGEALSGIENQRMWLNEVILPGIKDGMKDAGLTKEPPVVVRTHATDLAQIMPESLKIYSNLYTEAKYNGESLTTWEPRGLWQQRHLDMSRLGSTHVANVHILANLEPFRYGDQEFIRKSVLAARDRLGARGLHLYPLAYWSWPDSPDKTEQPLQQIDRDWIWFEAWARYSWNPDVDPTEDHAYWIGRLASRYGNASVASHILDAYNAAGECAPRILRRYGITEGNRQTMSLGMTLDQLVSPEKYRAYSELWDSQAPVGERLQEFVTKEWAHQAHVGETPLSIADEIEQYSKKAVDAIDLASKEVGANQAEFARLRNDVYCIREMSLNYAAKARAAVYALRYRLSKDVSDMDKAADYLRISLEHYRELERLTRDTYRFANTMQTSQRRIPISGGNNGQPANYHWTQLLPVYEKEYADFQKQVSDLHASGGKALAQATIKPLKKASVRIIAGDAQVYSPQPGSKVFTDEPWELQSLASELVGLEGIRFSHQAAAAGKLDGVSFECKEPVYLLVGYIQSKQKPWLQVPDLETDALAGETFVSEPLLRNAAAIDTLPQVNIHIHRFPAGVNKLELRGSGSFIVLGVVAADPELLKGPVGTQSQNAVSLVPRTPRYQVAVCDWMILKRQKLGAFDLAKELGAEGLELDMGGLGTRSTFDTKLDDPAIRAQFLEKAKSTGLVISSLAMSAFYAQSLATRENFLELVQNGIDTMTALNLKVAFLPLGVECDLVKHPELRPILLERLRKVGAAAEKAGVVIGIETALDAKAEAAFLDEIGSKAIKSYFNFSNPLKNGRDLLAELRTLGRDRICMIHCTDEDGVWLQNNTRLDLHQVKTVLDQMDWSGWLVIERSRDAKDPRNVKYNFTANVAYVRSVFEVTK